MSYDYYKNVLQNLLNNLPQTHIESSLKNNSYLLKGDISGIQDFIFNTKSKGASKTLKSKSFYVQAIAEMCVRYIADTLQAALLYNSGGNFYMFVEKNDSKLQEIKRTIEQSLQYEEIFVALSWVENNPNEFAQTKEKLERESSRDKLQKFKSIGWQAFQPFENIYRQKENWKGMVEELVKSKGFEIAKKKDGKEGLPVDHLQKFGYEYKFSKHKNQFQGKIINQLPRWKKTFDNLSLPTEDLDTQNEGIINFETLAKFAHLRTGTEKIAVLKMDIDFLGTLFKERATIEETQMLSQALTWFFEKRIVELLNQPLPHPEAILQEQQNNRPERKLLYNQMLFTYFDNIYVVFSGGDDCFLLGAWDTVFDFALLLQKEFHVFQQVLRNEYLPIIQQDKSKQQDITLSASLTLVEAKYPVVRFAELAEEALAQAKAFKQPGENQPSKNKIAILGAILTWNEVHIAQQCANKIKTLIYEKNEPRAIIERIKNSARGFAHLQSKAQKGKIHFSNVWRLKYYLRNAKNKNDVEEIFNQYIAAIMKSIANHQQTINPETFIVAARWAEFLTRKSFLVQTLKP